MTQIEKEMPNIRKDSDNDQFQEAMQSFVLVSAEELKDVEQLVQKVETDFAAILKFFAVDSKMQPEEFFAIFKKFAMLFEV